MKRPHIAALSAFASLVMLTASRSTVAQEAPKVPRVTMTADDLRALGIAAQRTGAKALPNTCAAVDAADLSLSDEMVASFKSRGFSLESLCLGLISYFRFDPETGRPMPVAALPDGSQYVLNLPSCFQRAAPLLDCNYVFEHDWGVKIDAAERKNLRDVGHEIDAIARKRIANAGASGLLYPYKDCGKSAGLFCVKVHGRDIFVMLERVVFSQVLPLGYGYGFQLPEGDDPEEETVDLSTYRKRSSGSLFWSDEKRR